mmetsp:Transcript_115417/g.337512  ORF Transcript_115417/g.337512 Transcript_115417/m.337512 type:complete len:262 (+) Transcript_115417:1977-2762(+)
MPLVLQGEASLVPNQPAPTPVTSVLLTRLLERRGESLSQNRPEVLQDHKDRQLAKRLHQDDDWDAHHQLQPCQGPVPSLLHPMAGRSLLRAHRPAFGLHVVGSGRVARGHGGELHLRRQRGSARHVAAMGDQGALPDGDAAKLELPIPDPRRAQGRVSLDARVRAYVQKVHVAQVRKVDSDAWADVCSVQPEEHAVQGSVCDVWAGVLFCIMFDRVHQLPLPVVQREHWEIALTAPAYDEPLETSNDQQSEHHVRNEDGTR